MPNSVQTLDANDIRFSQSSVNDVQPIVDSMQVNGWVGDPIDVVRMPDGVLTSVDNSRLLAAKITDTPVKAIVHNFDDSISAIRAMGITKGKPIALTTWGEAINYRISCQNAVFRSIYPMGAWIIGWNGL